MIEEYVKTVVEAIDQLSLNENIRIQEKLDFFRDGRQAFGGSALILQGGATFGTSPPSSTFPLLIILTHHRVIPFGRGKDVEPAWSFTPYHLWLGCRSPNCCPGVYSL